MDSVYSLSTEARDILLEIDRRYGGEPGPDGLPLSPIERQALSMLARFFGQSATSIIPPRQTADIRSPSSISRARDDCRTPRYVTRCCSSWRVSAGSEGARSAQSGSRGGFMGVPTMKGRHIGHSEARQIKAVSDPARQVAL
jgi:hypothetical protein